MKTVKVIVSPRGIATVNGKEVIGIDTNGQPLQPGEYECKEVWQAKVKNKKYWCDLSEERLVIYKDDPMYEVRQIYQSIEAAVKGEKEWDFPKTDEGEVLGYISFKNGDLKIEPYRPEQSTPVNEAKDYIRDCTTDAGSKESLHTETVEQAAERILKPYWEHLYVSGWLINKDHLPSNYIKERNLVIDGLNYRATHPIENKEGVKYNSIEPTSHKTELEKYAPIRQADPERDKDYSPIHDAIMSAIWDRFKEHCSEAINPVWNSSLFPERLTKQCLRIFESFAAQFTPIEQGKRMVKQEKLIEDLTLDNGNIRAYANQLEDVLKDLADIPSTSIEHQEARAKAFSILNQIKNLNKA